VTDRTALTDFRGARAVVSGGARGIGAAIVSRLAELGVAVFSADIREPTHQREGVNEVRCDVTRPSDINQLAELTGGDGGIDILVNNAAITSVHMPWLEIDDDDWAAVIAANLKAPFDLARAFHAQLARSHAGRIVNIGSVVPILGMPGLLHYSATKASLLGLTRSLARELGPNAITVNLVSPGAIQAESEEEANAVVQERGEQPLDVVSLQAIQRRGTPDDVANAVTFLASPRSGFITGQTLVVDGGWTMQ